MFGRCAWQAFLHIVGLTVVLLFWASFAAAQSASPNVQQQFGMINGAVLDDTGTAIQGAKVMLSHGTLSASLEAVTGTDGAFSFSNVPPGSFRLTVTAPGFAEQAVSGIVTAGEAATLPPIHLTLAAETVAVEVTPTEVLAERQIKEQEQQRLFGVVPNFFVSYNPDAVPLTTNQKFELSWKTQLDPVTLGLVAAVAGVQQKQHAYSGFGEGGSGYAKRYGALYATIATRSLITQVLLASVFKQDPRYFYSGTGSTGSRFVYAISRVVIRKGDNGRSQPNYSGILGTIAASGISNFYYPAQNRQSPRLTLENTAIGFAASAVGHLAQEFLFSKLTTRASPNQAKKSAED
jgi:uncharacterized lipoprotein YbaY